MEAEVIYKYGFESKKTIHFFEAIEQNKTEDELKKLFDRIMKK